MISFVAFQGPFSSILKITNTAHYDICNSITCRDLQSRTTSSRFTNLDNTDKFLQIYLYLVCKIIHLILENIISIQFSFFSSLHPSRNLCNFEKLTMIIHVYAYLPSFPEWTKLENCIKKIFRRIMLVRVFYMTQGRTSLWKIFKLQMHNSPTNVAYALNMQFCIMINRKI